MKKLKKIIAFISKSKAKVTTALTAGFVIGMTTMASAAPVADADTVAAVSDGMKAIQMTALAVVAAVAVVAVTLFAAPYAWQYGKKIFKTVAR